MDQSITTNQTDKLVKQLANASINGVWVESGSIMLSLNIDGLPSLVAEISPWEIEDYINDTEN